MPWLSSSAVHPSPHIAALCCRDYPQCARWRGKVFIHLPSTTVFTVRLSVSFHPSMFKVWGWGQREITGTLDSHLLFFNWTLVCLLFCMTVSRFFYWKKNNYFSLHECICWRKAKKEIAWVVWSHGMKATYWHHLIDFLLKLFTLNKFKLYKIAVVYEANLR